MLVNPVAGRGMLNNPVMESVFVVLIVRVLVAEVPNVKEAHV